MKRDENWILTDSLLHQLEGGIGHHILNSVKIPVYSFGSQMASITATIFVPKLISVQSVLDTGGPGTSLPPKL